MNECVHDFLVSIWSDRKGAVLKKSKVEVRKKQKEGKKTSSYLGEVHPSLNDSGIVLTELRGNPRNGPAIG